jgi:hypothetical protein
MFLKLLLLTQMLFYWETHAIPHFSWTGWFGAYRASLHLENYEFQGVFLSKSNSIITGKQCYRSSTDGFLGEIRVFLHLSWICLVGANRAYLHLETPKLQEVFLEKLTQFSRETRCYMLLFLSEMVFFWEIHLLLKNSDSQEVFLSNSSSVLTEKQGARCSCFYQRWFSLERYMCFFNIAE